MSALTGPVVARLSGASYRQIDLWARTGVLVPDFARANGQGSQRAYSPAQIEVARVLKMMSDAGVHPTREAATAITQAVHQGERRAAWTSWPPGLTIKLAWGAKP